MDCDVLNHLHPSDRPGFGPGGPQTYVPGSGCWLRGADGEQTSVEAIDGPKESALVYNLEVAEYHTYFGGGETWGFSVLAQNYANINPDDVAAVAPRAGLRLEQRAGKWVTISTNSGGQEVVRSATGTYDFVTVNGRMRVLRMGSDPISTHTAMAGAGPVDYAGRIVFSGRTNRGKIRF